MVQLSNDCFAFGGKLMTIDEALTLTATRVQAVDGEERLPLAECDNRVLVSPLHAPDLAGLAPAFVLLAGCDVLRDEGRAYAARMIEAGVATVLDEVPGVLHGFANMQGLAVARGATTRLAQWLDVRFEAAARG
jgi:acetyl esterase/lipase